MRRMVSTLLIGAVLTTVGICQSTSTSITVGGPGATGCSNGTLTNGQPGSATVDFTYDRGTHLLTVVVENTSPVIPGLKNPLITRLFFNLPHRAVTSANLISQTPASGTMNWDFDYDVDLTNGSSLSAACMGDWGVRLKTPNGINTAIANANATDFASSNYVLGPVTFVIEIVGPGAGNLTAGAFSSSLSSAGDQANVVMHFQGGGTDGGISGWIANNEGCSAGTWYVGEPRINSTIEFVQTSSDGCYGCIIASLDPGPTTAFGVTVPVGLPYVIITSALFPFGSPTNTQVTPVVIPDNPFLVGFTFYGCVVTVDIATQSMFSVSDQFVLTVLP